MFYPKSPFLKCPGIESQIFKRNPIDVKKIFEWLCETPKFTTYRINLTKSTLDAAKSHIKKVLETKYSKNIPEIFCINDIPEVICISPLKELISFNSDLSEIIVDVSCGCALLRGAHIYGPGVLAMPSGTQIGDNVNVFADLSGKCKKGTNILYESNEKIFIGTGRVKMQRYQLYGKDVNPKGIAIEMLQVISGVPSIGDLSSDKFLLQNLPSIVCGRVLNPQPNEIILDMCAAPGNKTSHIFELTKGESTIIAIDKVKSKIESLKAKIKNDQWKNVYSFSFDSTKCFDVNIIDKTKTNLINGPPFGAESFDRILLDAPCSSLGNRPLLTCKMTEKMLKSYPPVQKKLFANAANLLKCGGTLVYSTCTIHEDENEGIVVWAKEKFPELELVRAEPILGGSAIESDGLSNEDRNNLQRFCIDNVQKELDTIGFFIAKFIKRKSIVSLN